MPIVVAGWAINAETDKENLKDFLSLMSSFRWTTMLSKILTWRKILDNRKQLTNALHSRLKLGKSKKNGLKLNEVRIFWL